MLIKNFLKLLICWLSTIALLMVLVTEKNEIEEDDEPHCHNETAEEILNQIRERRKKQFYPDWLNA
jgi:hypothetical protein